MSTRSDYADAINSFDAALSLAIDAHEALRAAYAACGGVAGAPTQVPDLLFKPLTGEMVTAWRRRVADAQDWLNG